MSFTSNQEIPMDIDEEPQSSSSSSSNIPNTADKQLEYKPSKKVLYFCRSFKELQEKAKPSDELYDNLSQENLVKRASKCYEKAEGYYQSGDEELAYIFYNYSLDADIELESRSGCEDDQDEDQDEDQDDDEDDDEDPGPDQVSHSRQDYILQMLKILKDSLKSRYGHNWKQSSNNSTRTSPQQNQPQTKLDENHKEILIEELLENEPEPFTDIQLKVSPKDYATQLQQMIDSVDLLNEKKKELKVTENLVKTLSERENLQSGDNVFKDFIPDDNKCQFGCYSAKGFVLGDNFVCKNGHRVCSKHRPDLPICPECENEWLTLSENYFMSLERECPFAEKGCQEKVKLEDMEKHLGICEWTVGNKQVLKLHWRKIVIGAKIMALEVKVEQERKILDEMEEPLTKAGCENAPLEILRQRLNELEKVINGEKNKASLKQLINTYSKYYISRFKNINP